MNRYVLEINDSDGCTYFHTDTIPIVSNLSVKELTEAIKQKCRKYRKADVYKDIQIWGKDIADWRDFYDFNSSGNENWAFRIKTLDEWYSYIESDEGL